MFTFYLHTNIQMSNADGSLVLPKKES